MLESRVFVGGANGFDLHLFCERAITQQFEERADCIWWGWSEYFFCVKQCLLRKCLCPQHDEAMLEAAWVFLFVLCGNQCVVAWVGTCVGWHEKEEEG